ncbi:MAG: histidine phosphatase family protein [Thermoanaerobaculales bacterium]|jgi:phosphohistidine phosphatase|nr:histidine phosphatase family protein [Thermoanaerobaculales bacterium]
MRQLLIMRHAKSDWGSGVAGDLDRPLAPRGAKAAKRMGRMITRLGSAPDLVLTSPAVRARSTAELAARGGGWSAPTVVVEGFYGGGWRDVVEGLIAAAADQTADRILVVGHEPTWSELVSVLTGGSRIAMPTGAVACVAVDGEGWSELGPGRGELGWHLVPRMLEGLG